VTHFEKKKKNVHSGRMKAYHTDISGEEQNSGCFNTGICVLAKKCCVGRRIIITQNPLRQEN
jgi:hypothetical protein